MDNIIEQIIRQFQFQGTFLTAEEMKAGHINTTYKLSYRQEDGSITAYVLQKINTGIFTDPVALMENICLVVAHIKSRQGRDQKTQEFIQMTNGGYLCQDANGEFWRAYEFIADAVAYDSIEDPRHFYEAGRGFGAFQRYLADFPAEKLTATIPNFHHTTKRFYAFVAAVAEDKAGRASSIEREIDFFFDRRKMMNRIIALTESGVLPTRVTHNDTKLNNVLIDSDTGKAVCVIDLDTVMPGSILYDYGDAIRFGACTAAEDEPDVTKVGLDMELFKQFTDGFVSEIAATCTPEEIRYLPLGALVITCEQAMRFLTDYINGDTYFKVQYPEHNLVRARAQMRLVEEIEAHWEEMQAYIDARIPSGENGNA